MKVRSGIEPSSGILSSCHESCSRRPAYLDSIEEEEVGTVDEVIVDGRSGMDEAKVGVLYVRWSSLGECLH